MENKGPGKKCEIKLTRKCCFTHIYVASAVESELVDKRGRENIRHNQDTIVKFLQVPPQSHSSIQAPGAMDTLFCCVTIRGIFLIF